MDNRAIGLFDSGVGGLTVLKELQRLMPNEHYIYIGDTASFPYGSKSKQTIKKKKKKRIENLIDMNVKMIVIACGTATSQALEEMQKMFNIPIIGIISPTVDYLKEKNIKKIGVIATAGTIKSEGWKKQIERDIPDAKLINRACPLLASMAEEGWTDNEIARLAIHEYLKDIKDIDALILGCTHYPLFKKVIEKEIGANVDIINTGEMVAKNVQKYILENQKENENKNLDKTDIYLTDLECNFMDVAKKLMQVDNLDVKKIN